MPIPFKPAMTRGLARGLRVVEGEANAAARARALRASAARRAAPEFTDVASGATFRGVSPAIEASAAETMAREAAKRHARARGIRFSPEATARQQRRLDLMTSRAGKVEDPRAWPGYDPEAQAHELATRGQRMTPEEFANKWKGEAADLNRDFRGAVEEDARRRALERSNARRGMTPEKLAEVEARLRGIRADVEGPALRRHFQAMTEQEQGSNVRQFPRRPAQAQSGLLDAFENQYGWRPASEKEARDMLSPEALRELGFPEAP